MTGSGIPSQATALALVKSLLLQLLNLRIGNMATYHALIHAYEHCIAASDVGVYADHLWRALTDALQCPIDNGNDLIIIVDGLDELVGDKSEQSSLLHRLLKVTTQGTRVRLITLSSSASMPSDIDGTHHSITAQDTREDIHAVAFRSLIHNRRFQAQPGPEQESLLDQIISTANGSFLYAILVCEVLRFDKSGDGISKSLQTLDASHPSVHDLVLKLITSLEPDKDAKKLLSWILASERPFTIHEISCLFSIDPHHGTVTDKNTDLDCIIQSLRPLLTLNEHIVRFRHSSIQLALKTFVQNGKLALPIKDVQTDLVLRTLTYVRHTLRTPIEPEIDPIDQSLAIRLYRQHHFLEYVVRYWVLHLKKSALAPKGSGEFKPSAELSKVFPDTPTLALLERLTWDLQWPAPEALNWHILVGTVRRTILKENHPAVLQTYLAIGSCYTILSKHSEAQYYYYISTKISRTVLSETHPLTLRIAELYLDITQTLTSTTRTEIMTRREDIIILLITAYERQRGSTSDLVIRMRKLLADLYTSIKEEERALEIYRLIQQLTIKQYGKNSDQARDAQGCLNVALGKRKNDCEIQTYKDTFFGDEDEEEEETIDITSIDQIILWFRRAETYLSHGEISLAERTYVELWQQISTKCRTVHSIEWHQKNIEIVTAYSRFLHSQKRTSEASSVLVSVWKQYENHQLSHTESIVTQLTSVAKVLKTMGTHTIALSIFKFASSYYKNVRREESQSLIEINEEISSTTTEIVKQSLTSSTTVTETTTTISESAFQDVFQSVIVSCKTIDSSTIALAKKLTVQYIEKRNYSAAITVIKTTLQRTWSSFFSSSIHEVTLSSKFLSESIELIERLVEIHLKERHFEKVEDIYVRLFRAVLVTTGVDKKLFDKALNLLVTYYDSHGYADNAISVYQEVLVVYRKSLGPIHTNTIQTLYILASRCRAHPRNHPYWLEYYQQIVTSLNKDSDVCHKDAIEAINIVANCYWEDRRYAEAVTVYIVLWNTFFRQTKEYKHFSDVTYVQRLYERYFQCLEETKAGWETLHQVTKQYRETCIATFSAEATISVEATLSLAQVTQRSEEHAMEAISLFEAVSTSSKVTSTKVTEIKHALSSLYVRQISSQSSTSIKKETLQRAISMREEQFTEATHKYGYSHETTLTHLHELSTLFVRQQKTELAVKKLTIAVSEIIIKETSSQKMYECAQSIASTFIACHQEVRCTELIQELHRQICAKDSRNVSKWSFDVTKSGRCALAFLASLEYAIRRDLSITFAEILADITAEAIYFEYFLDTVKKNKSVKDVILAAVSLRTYLLHRKRTAAVAFVEDEATIVFTKRDTANINVLSKDSSRIFIVSILDYLGHHKSRNFIRAVITASNERVASLTKDGKFPEAYDIANFGFLFASGHDGYNGPKSIGQGFKLASLLVGDKGRKTADANLRKKTLELSNRIVKKILDICKALNINFAQVQLPELSRLAALLGEQQDYATLEVRLVFHFTLPFLYDYALTLETVASHNPLEYPRRATLLAINRPHHSRSASHQRPLPCRTPYQSNSTMRRYCIQHAPCPWSSLPEDSRDVRVASPTLY
jgi:tetratricopeptide (TPR) repeat protein